MKHKLSALMQQEFVKFFLVSLFAAVVNFGSRIFFSTFMGYVLAVVLAFCCGVITAFVGNKHLVFKRGKEKTIKQFYIFLLINIGGLLQTLIVSLLFKNLVFPAFHFAYHTEEISHLIGIGIPVFTNYFAHKYFSFKE